MTLEEVRQVVLDARASGISPLSVEEIFEQAREIARGRGTLRGEGSADAPGGKRTAFSF